MKLEILSKKYNPNTRTHYLHVNLRLDYAEVRREDAILDLLAGMLNIKRIGGLSSPREDGTLDVLMKD